MTPCFLADCAVLHMKLIAAHGSMVDAPCPDIAFYIAVAKWTPVSQTFLLHNTILHIKSVPTDRSMVYLPRRYVTGHMPIARGTNVIIGLRQDASVLDSETVTACAAVIYLACAYSTGHRLIAVRTHVLETLAFPRGSCPLCRQGGLLRPVAVFLCATYICTPFGGHFCSVLLSALFCLRPFFLRLGALLFSIPFSLRDGSPDISNGACLFSFRCPHRYFRLRCSYPLYRFADASPGNGAFPTVATDLVTITRTMLRQPRFKRARCLLYLADAASPPAPCFTRTI